MRRQIRAGRGPDTDALFIDVAGQDPRQIPQLEPIGRLSADGTWLLSPWSTDDSHGAAIVDVRSGQRWDLPRGKFYAWISWSYADLAVVVVDREGARGPVLACGAVKRRCEQLPRRGTFLLPTS